MTDRRRDDDPLIIGDAHNETLDVPTFATPLAIVGSVSETDGVSPQVRDEDHVVLDHRAMRVHDMLEDTPAGVPARRVAPQVVNDYGAPYSDAPAGQSPYGQSDPFDAQNRTTRVADDGGAVALFSSLERNVGSEDGRFARALTCVELNGGPQSPKVAVPPDPPLPDGVEITEAGAVGGSGGVVISSQPAVNVNGLRIEGAAAVEAAKEANRQGGTAEAIRDAALVAASAEQGGREQPPVDVGNNLRSQTKKNEPPPAAPVPAPSEKPGGYLTGDGLKVGQLGTFFAPGSGHSLYPGSRGEQIGTLPARWDAQLALDHERRGPLWIKDEDAAKVQELRAGVLVKGWLQPDTSLKDKLGQVPGNTHAYAVVIRVPAPPPPGDPPPPPPPPPPTPPPGLLLWPNFPTVPKPPDGTVRIPDPGDGGTEWIITHDGENKLLIRKHHGDGVLVGGVQISPDGTVTQVDGDGSSDYGLVSSPDGTAHPLVTAAEAAELAANLDRTLVYVDSSTGVLSAVSPDGTVTPLAGTGASGQSASTLPGGNGSEGDYDPADGATLTAGIHNYDDFTLDSGKTIKGEAGAFNFVQVAGNAAIDGTINLDGRGNAGGVGGAGSALVQTGTSTAGTAGTAGTGTKAATAGGGGGGGGGGLAGGGGSAGAGGAGSAGGNRGSGWSTDGAGTAGAAGTGGNPGGGAGGAGGAVTDVNPTLLARRVSQDFLIALLGGAGGGGGGGGSGSAETGGSGAGAGGAGGTGYDADGNGNDGADGTAGVGQSGGGGGGQGARGGGQLVLVVRGNVTGTFTINARGGTGGDGGSGNATGGDGAGGGGGGGGFVLIVFYGSWSATATINVGGGTGGASGGGGAGSDGEDGFYAVINGASGEVVQWGGSLTSIDERTSAAVAVQSTVTSAPSDPVVLTAPSTVIPFDTTGGAFAVSLPEAANVETGDAVTFKDVNTSAGTNALTINRSGSDTIDDGATSDSIATNNGSKTFRKIGATSWISL